MTWFFFLYQVVALLLAEDSVLANLLYPGGATRHRWFAAYDSLEPLLLILDLDAIPVAIKRVLATVERYDYASRTLKHLEAYKKEKTIDLLDQRL